MSKAISLANEKGMNMTEAYIFDYVKTPRGRGKSSGSLHEITPIDLLTQVLKALKDRSDFDPLITT